MSGYATLALAIIVIFVILCVIAVSLVTGVALLLELFIEIVKHCRKKK